MRKIIIDNTIHEIQNWTRNYVKNANADGVIVCVSGGVDSAVILALCVNALGKKKITALILPCQSQPQDEIDAKLVGDETYVETEEISKLNLNSLTATKAKCAFIVHGRLFIEEFKGWVDGYGTFFCTEEEFVSHV